MKRCSKCGEFKPLADFGISARARDGRQTYCLACNRAACAEWYRANRVAHQNTVRAAAAANRPMKNAHKAVARAINSGRLAKPANCTKCGRSGFLHAHHDDYAKPLDVHWLCRSCHRLAHAAAVR